MYVRKVLDFSFQLLKNGSENKNAAFIFLFSADSHGLVGLYVLLLLFVSVNVANRLITEVGALVM